MSSIKNTNPLHKARKVRNFTVENVANDLKTSKLYILSLENDDIQSLKGKIYINGLIRSYAKYLGLNQEEVIAYFRSLENHSSTANLTATESVKNNFLEYKFMHSDIKIYLISLILIISAYLIWFMGRPSVNIKILYHPAITTKSS